MSCSSKDIPDEVWSRHKHTILKLRFDESLPLDAAKSKSRNIVQVMKDDHGFEATAAQYETQLKKWKAAKNLKRKDWETILPIYNDLEKRNLNPRVRLGDQILDERKVKKARRYLTSNQERTEESDALLNTSKESRLWRIEYCRDDGEYTDYSGRHLGTNNRETSPSTALSPGDMSNFSSATQNRSAQENVTWDLGQYQGSTTNSQLVTHHLPLSSPLLNFEDFEPMPNFLLGQDISLDTRPGSSQSDRNGLGLPSSVEVENSDLIFDELDAPLATSNDHPASTLETVNPESLVLASHCWDPPSPRMSDIYNCIRLPAPSLYQSNLVLSKDLITFTLEGIYKDPALRLSIDIQSLSAQHIKDSLVSLLFDYVCGQGMLKGSSLMAHHPIPTSEIFKRVIFSIANNFSGLANIPRAVILGMLKSFSSARSDLVACLQWKNVKFSKPLADNLFRAAVEAGDEELVGIILDTTSDQANVVNINEIICEVDHARFSALAMAANLHRPAMVRKLLQHGAKVGGHCFTCECGTGHIAGCRNLGIRDCPLTVIYEQYGQLGQYRWPMDQYYYMRKISDPACTVSEAAEIVEMILESEPVMATRLLKDSRFFGINSDRLLELLAQAVPPDRHAVIFEPLKNQPRNFHTAEFGALRSIVEKLEPQRTKQILSTLLSNCQRMGCTHHQINKSLNYAANLAVLSKKFDLADYFLTIIKPDQGNLAAAIRSRRTDLVDSLLEQGALMNHGNAPCLDDMSHPFDSVNGCKPTTPLAEAIRLQDAGLIKRLEEYGALNRISEGHLEDFAAALFATVEVADSVFLKQLLSTARPTFREWNAAIISAIKRSHFEMAIALISHDVTRCFDCDSDVVTAALESGNNELVQIILDFSDNFNVRKGVVMASVQQGDTNAVEALLELNTESLREALGLAIKNGNVELAAILLERGANPESLFDAIRMGDANLLNLLLQHGADPADEAAFSCAIGDRNMSLLEILVGAFAARYPDGKEAFAERCAILAIQADSFVSLNLLLKLKLNPNRWQRHSKNLLVEVIASCRENEVEDNEIVRCLVNAGASLEFQAEHGMTALLQAIENNNMQLVEFLLQNGAQINRPARWGVKRTPLQQACEMGSFEMVEFLVTKGAIINAPPTKDGGATALQLAAISGSVRIVEFLLNNGAEIHAAPALGHGRTALEGAAEHGRVSVLDILLQRGAQKYSRDDILKAKFYAKKERQRGCEERLKQALFWARGQIHTFLN